MFGFGKNNEQVPQNIHPIPHDRSSAAMTTMGAASGEGLKGAGKGFLNGFAGVAIIGGAIAALAATSVIFPSLLPAISFAGGGGGLGAIGWGALKVLGVAAAGVAGAVVAGATLGVPVGSFTGIFGGLFGAGKGMKEGSQRVGMERAAAMQVQHELGGAAMETQAMMAQAQAMGHRNAADAYSAFPPQGSPMNAASPQINAADIAEHTRLADMELQRA